MKSRILKNYANKVSYAFKKGIHNGIDIIGDNGKNNGAGYLDYILAHSDGKIVGIRKDYQTNDKTGSSYGNYILIKHDNGYYTLYAHLKYGSINLNVGDTVTKGQVIAYMGNTGMSYGAHLHFEVRDTNNVKIDPTPFINADLPSSAPICEPVSAPVQNSSQSQTEDILTLVKKTIRGDFGNGETRKKALGANYEEVQKQVNLNIKNGTTNWNNIRLY